MESDIEIHNWISCAKNDIGERNRLIETYKPFIIKVVSKICGRFIQEGVDEELSIGLMAFNEAIEVFDAHKGAFFSFSETVIKRRLIDYYRKEKRTVEVLMSVICSETDGKTDFIESERANFEFEEKTCAMERKEEVQEFNNHLKEYGIALSDLLKSCPKQEGARIRAIKMAQMIAADSKLREHLLTNKTLPINAMLEKVKISRKTIERHRKYIIAVTLILVEDFPYLLEYIKGV